MKKEQATLTVKMHEGELVLSLCGEIDHHTARPLRERMDAEIYERAAMRVRIDLCGVSFMDSSGLGLVLGRLAVARQIGVPLVLSGADKRTMRIFDMAGLGRVSGLTIEV